MIKMILVLQYTTLDPRSPYDTNAINAVWHYPYLFGGSGLKFLDPRIQKLGWVRDLQFISGLRRGHLRSLTILLAVYTRSLYSVFWAQVQRLMCKPITQLRLKYVSTTDLTPDPLTVIPIPVANGSGLKLVLLTPD